MAKKQLHIRASGKTEAQLRELAEQWGTTITDVVSTAVDRLHREEATVEIRCSVCDGRMGYTPAELSAQVAAKGHDTPEQCGFDPADVTWYHGWHKDDIGDPDWDEEEPYWSGSIADLHTAAAAELREEE